MLFENGNQCCLRAFDAAWIRDLVKLEVILNFDRRWKIPRVAFRIHDLPDLAGSCQSKFNLGCIT